MSDLRSLVPVLVIVLMVLLAAGLLVWRLAGFGKEIDEAAHRKR